MLKEKGIDEQGSSETLSIFPPFCIIVNIDLVSVYVVVRFQISQIGDDEAADTFLGRLAKDPGIKDYIYVTSGTFPAILLAALMSVRWPLPGNIHFRRRDETYLKMVYRETG